MLKLGYMVWLVVLAVIAIAFGVRAQETPAPGQTDAAEVQVEGGKTSQTSVQGTVPGTYSNGRSLLLPSISLTTQMRSDSPDQGYGSHSTQSYLLGRLNLRRVSGRSELQLDYVGGGVISTGRDGTSSFVQMLDLSRTVVGRRSSVLFGGAVSYLPESSFGFGGGAGLSDPSFSGQPSGAIVSSTATSLSDGATPNQTILTARAQRLSGVMGTRLEYRLSPRSSWTASGSYGLLRFYGSGYIDNSNSLLQTGYNYQVSRKNTVSVSYRFSDFRFADVSQGVDEHDVLLSFARQVNGQLHVQIAAGPSLVVFHSPLSGSPIQSGWSATSGLTYQIERMVLGLSYDRLLTGGSGVLVAAQTNQLQATVGRVLTRMWQGSAAVGYARNQGFAQTVPSTDQKPLQSWFGTARLSRRLRTETSLSVGYSVRRQGNYSAVCTGLSCGQSFVTHEISFGLSWGLRPITL
jgi:hypothetical protein